MSRRMSLKEKLARCFCDKRELNRKAIRIQQCLREIQELLNRKC